MLLGLILYGQGSFSAKYNPEQQQYLKNAK